MYTVLTVLSVAGTGLYVLALPDLHPIDPSVFAVDSIRARFEPPPDPSRMPGLDADGASRLARSRPARPAPDARVAAARAQLAPLGMPLRGVAVLHPRGGDQLVLILNAEQITSGALPGSTGAAAGYVALIDLAEAKQVDVHDLASVVAVVRDARGRDLYRVAVLTGPIQAYRAGAIDRKTYIKHMAFQEISTLGVIDQLRRQFGL